MPLDQDVNQAISRLHFGTTLPFWDRAVRVQLARLKPTQDWAVAAIVAAKRHEKGTGTAEDASMAKSLADVVEHRFKSGEGPSIYSTQDRVDSIFLLLAVRSILTMADRIVEQLKPLGKESQAAQARNKFSSKYGFITHLRDVTLHYDAYVVGQGAREDLVKDPNEGLGVTEDEKGFILIMWAGHRIRLLDAAQAALVLSRDLTQMFWGPLTQP
jgi:hypothetical protein